MNLESLKTLAAPKNAESLTAKVLQEDPQLDQMLAEFTHKMALEAQKSQGRYNIVPIPGFVVKTRTTEAFGDYPQNIKGSMYND